MRYVTLAGVFSVAVFGACAERAEVGEACLHNSDCDTTYCLAGKCGAKPTQNTTSPPVAPLPDSGSVGATDANVPGDATDAAVDAPRDAGAADGADGADGATDSSTRDGSDGASGDAHAADAAGAS
jgi:hypothetical protein